MKQWFDTEFPLAMKDLRNESSVGLGVMSRLGATVGQALGWDGATYKPARVAYFRELVWARLGQILNGTYKPYPINVFVKPEPHKLKKLQEGRERLILAVALEDTMIDRLLYRRFQRNLLENWVDYPVKMGYAPIKGLFRILAYDFPEGSLSIDKSGWDWSVPGWLVGLWSDFLEDLAGGGPDWWVKIHRQRTASLFGPGCCYEFADGSQATQNFWGVMKSGCYNTLFLNSVGQVVIAYLANKRLGTVMGRFWTVGDDTVERNRRDVPQYVREIEKLGFTVKEWTVNGYVEFCGFLANKRECKPAYLLKHLFKAFHEGGESYLQKIAMYRLLYAYDDLAFQVFDQIHRMLSESVPEPREFLLAFWSGALP